MTEGKLGMGSNLGTPDGPAFDAPEPTREHWEGLCGLLQFCTTHMAPRVWTGEDNCVYRASWKASYPDSCNFEWMRFSFDVEPQRVAEWINRDTS